MDLHKAAEVFKLDIAHIDRPAAMLGVYRCAAGASPAEAAARGLHERLLRRFATYRSRWSDEALQAAVLESLAAIAEEHRASAGVAGAVALLLGAKLVTAVAHGACCAIADSLPDDIRDVRTIASSGQGLGGTSAVAACVALDRASAACILLQTDAFGEDAARSAASHVVLGRPRAGAAALLQNSAPPHDPVIVAGARAAPHRAAACARLAWTGAPEDGDGVAAKRARTEGGGLLPAFSKEKGREREREKVRCRQILLKYAGCRQATDPVRRRAVRRSLAEAESSMLQVLGVLEAARTSGGGVAAAEAAFTQQCRANSECTSSLKGGDLAGDVGWLRLPEVKPGEKVPKDVAARVVVIRAALALEVGEVSDIVVSDDGVHLLKRSA